MLATKDQEKRAEQVLLDHRKLLAGPEKEQIDFGKLIAPNCKLVQRETDLGKLIEKQAIAKTYGSSIPLNKIQEECMKYNLRILPLKVYKGDFGLDYLSNVKSFIEHHNIYKGEKHELRENLFALFPREPFDYQRDEISETYKGDNIKNPTILYINTRNDTEKKYGVIVHKGTPYVNPINRIRGFKNAYALRHTLVNLITFLFIVGLGTSLPCVYLDNGWLRTIIILISIILPIIMLVIAFVPIAETKVTFNRRLTETIRVFKPLEDQ